MAVRIAWEMLSAGRTIVVGANLVNLTLQKTLALIPLFRNFIAAASLAALTAATLTACALANAQQAAPPAASANQPVDAGDVETAPEPARLIDRQPFDRITLDAANDNTVFETVLLDLPERKLPDPKPTTGELTFRRLAQPGTPYAVNWAAVAKVEFYEQMVLAEAERLTAAGKFAQAFDDLAYLRSNYPDLPELEPALQAYLWRDASTAFAAGDGQGAWPALVALYGRNPEYPRLANAVQAVSDGLIGRQLAQKNYAAARAVLDQVEKHFPALKLANIANWRNRFQNDAQAQLEKARAALAARDYEAARDAAMFSFAILPEFGDARALLREIQMAAPEIRVGVTQAATPASLSRTPDWAAARGADLVNPRLVQMVAFGAEGGQYKSRFGELSSNDSGLETTLRFSPEGKRRGVMPEGVAARVIEMASSQSDDYQADLAAVLKGLQVVEGRDVRFQWRWPYLHPEALLQVPLRSVTEAAHAPGLWFNAMPAAADAVAIRYRRTGAARTAAGAPQFVIEQVYEDDEAALTALSRGEVDAVDRVPPWQVARIKQDREVVVAAYRLPTVHVLVPNPKSRLLELREFRRALCYGIDRDGIVKDILLGGESEAGFRALSGPFPAGSSVNDPVGYAYNSDLAPRPYEPRLAALLANVARTTLAKRDADERKAAEAAAVDKGDDSTAEEAKSGESQAAPADKAATVDAAEEKKPPPPDPLVLAHPADSLARVCCQSIKLQLEKAGIPIKLVELPANKPTASVEYDLLYAELVVREPLVDARRILAANGVAGQASALMMSALDAVDHSQNWNEARTRLRDIHRLAHYDLPVIPLWQTVNSFAYRKWLAGVGPQPVALYQNLDQWRKEFGK
jgi:tetratricopeptide (TPR) repeat protein